MRPEWPYEIEMLHGGEKTGHVAQAGRRLSGAGKLDRRTHFLRDDARHLFDAAGIDVVDAPDERNPIGRIAFRPRRQGAFGGRHRGIDLGFSGERDRAEGLFGGGVDQRMARCRSGWRPATIDIEIAEFKHGLFPFLWRGHTGSSSASSGTGLASKKWIEST